MGKAITYPETFKMSTSGSEKAVGYKLMGVLVHAGASVNAGHYYSYVRAANDMWYEMDDSSVQQVRYACKHMGIGHSYMCECLKGVSLPI